jgi:probable selenium-dependent hydroxylase accessory protein YqeC
MYALAKEMRARGHTVITTTTTKIFPPESTESPGLFLLKDDPSMDRLTEDLGRFGHVTAGSALLEVGKVDGVSESAVERFREVADAVVVEADGAAGRPVKAPAEWEPVVPGSTDLVIPVIGLDCIGRPAIEEYVFRLGHFLNVTGLRRNEDISPASIGRLLGHSGGALKGVSQGALVVPFLNKLDALSETLEIVPLLTTLLSASEQTFPLLVIGQLKPKVRLLIHRG